MQVASMKWVVRMVGRASEPALEQTVSLAGWGLEPGWREGIADDMGCVMRRGDGEAIVELLRVASLVGPSGNVYHVRTALASWRLEGWCADGVASHLPMVVDGTGEAGLEADERDAVFRVRQAIELEARRQARLWRERRRLAAAGRQLEGVA